jgi:beta-ketoacyl-acyl-carrier-protein synthase II
VKTTLRRVVITGLGVVSPIGNSTQDFFANLIAGRSGIRRIPDRDNTACGVADFDAAAHFTKLQLAGLDRFSQFGLVAAGQALDEAGLGNSDIATTRTGVYFGSGIGGANAIEEAYRAYLDPANGRIPPLTVVATMPNAAAAHISLRHGIRGPSLTYSVACASSAVAIGEAYRAIRYGHIDVAIAGGSEAIITPGMVAAWDAMKVLARTDSEHPERSCRPFSKNRSGLVVGEGAGALVLEAIDHAIDRGRVPLAEMAGYGVASDASHITKPSSEGQSAAIRLAIEDSGLPASEIGYVNAHGTATQTGDIAETIAIKQVFGATAHGIPVSSTKALHGHLMGAAGAVEAIASILALQTGSIPPTCHLTEPDPACDLDYVPNVARHGVELEAVMSNSFAFGGTNAVLVIKRYRQ